jgi:cytochrome oxidase assembly protein ShyY1
VVLQTSDTDLKDGLVRNWQPPQDRVAMHQSYSFQWFGMAFALLIFYVIASVRKRTPA